MKDLYLLQKRILDMEARPAREGHSALREREPMTTRKTIADLSLCIINFALMLLPESVLQDKMYLEQQFEMTCYWMERIKAMSEDDAQCTYNYDQIFSGSPSKELFGTGSFTEDFHCTAGLAEEERTSCRHNLLKSVIFFFNIN